MAASSKYELIVKVKPSNNLFTVFHLSVRQLVICLSVRLFL